jgi:hypothetical protein
MPEQFENPEAPKLEGATVAEDAAQKKIERMADKAAAKCTETSQKHDRDHPIFTI